MPHELQDWQSLAPQEGMPLPAITQVASLWQVGYSSRETGKRGGQCAAASRCLGVVNGFTWPYIAAVNGTRLEGTISTFKPDDCDKMVVYRPQDTHLQDRVLSGE